MSKKVSELMKELNVSWQELKSYADKLNIEISSARGSMDESAASRIAMTIHMLKGESLNSKDGDNKPKIKAVPIINKDTSKPKPPAAKPIQIQKKKNDDGDEIKDDATPTTAIDINQKEENEKKTSGDFQVEEKEVIKNENSEEKNSEEKNNNIEEKTETENNVDKEDENKLLKEKSESSPQENPNEKVSSNSEKEKKVTKSENKKSSNDKDEYINAPNKPMRFKKISDAATEKKIAEENRKKQRKNLEKFKESGNSNVEKNKSHKEGKKSDSKEGKTFNKDFDESKTRDKGSRDNGRSFGRGKSAAGVAQPVGSAKSGKGKSKRFFDNKDKDKQSRFDRREDGPGNRNKNSGNMIYDEAVLEKKEHHKKKYKNKVVAEPEVEEILPEGTVAVTVPITVAGLSEQAEISVSKIIMSMMQMGVMATINQTLDKDTVEMLAEDLGLQVVVTEEIEEAVEEGIDTRDDNEKDLVARPPIITVMGHVDHGKTSLLDAIRNTNVTAGESGGITQHIGASEIEINGKKIVFLDTPGHEAFTTMRARGAQVTDIAVLVVAADDGVMPQTIESISHAKAAGVPIIVAINKMDKAGANPDRVKQELSEHGVLVEDWGGDVISIPVSAKKGEGVTDLLEMILLQAEVLELKANPNRLAMGTVIEARLDKAKGPVATLLVNNGTLKTGQSVVAGTSSGKIRVMTDYKGRAIRKALPATPVEILGLSDVPAAGDVFNAVRDDKTAREIAANRKNKLREDVMAKNASTTLDKLFSQISEGETKDLNLIVKGDVQGSVGAIISSLEKLENQEVRIKIVHSGVGTINESDVMLAGTSNAIIIGFNVRPTTAVMNQATAADVEIRLYRVIYDIIDDIQDAVKGMLSPEFTEKVLGKAEVRDTFKVPNLGVVAGCYVIEGSVKRNEQIRLVRDGIVIHEGVISSLKRFKDDAKEVTQGFECGLGIEKYNDIKPGDVIECFTMVEVERK